MHANLVPDFLSINAFKKDIYCIKLEHNILVKAKTYYPELKKGNEPSLESKKAFEF